MVRKRSTSQKCGRHKLRITRLGGQRYALWMDGEYLASGMYSFVKDMRKNLCSTLKR